MRESRSYTGIKIVFAFFVVTFAAYAFSSYVMSLLESKLVASKPGAHLRSAQINRDLPTTIPVNQYNSIWEKDIFHTTFKDQKNESEPVSVEQLTLTSLNCSLIGTVTEKDGYGWAIIRDDDDSLQKMVTLGSNVKGARVVRILQDRVILNIGGKDELLLMDMEEKPARPSDRSGATSPRAQVLTYNVSQSLVQESLGNLASVMSGVRVEPYSEGGKPNGFRVSRLQQGSLLNNMGFRNGDIIKSVNGRTISATEDVMSLYNAMKESSFFRVGIIRNNKPVTIQIRVR